MSDVEEQIDRCCGDRSKHTQLIADYDDDPDCGHGYEHPAWCPKCRELAKMLNNTEKDK